MDLKNRIREQVKKSYFARKIFNWYCTQCFRRNPQQLASKDYKRVMGRELNWENPQNLIEKIYWLIFNTDTSLWSICADKYHVRDFVKERGCANMLNKLYGYWESVEDIDYNSLPSSFVMKTTNSSGQIIVVKDKSKLDIENANKTAVVEHEATTSKISEDQLFYCNQRGIGPEEAVGLIVNGYAREVLSKLPMEFAVEAQKLLQVSLEGSVG